MPPFMRTLPVYPIAQPDRGSVLTSKTLGKPSPCNQFLSLDLVCLLSHQLFPAHPSIAIKETKQLLRYLLHKSRSSIGILILAIFYFLY